ncbi:MAG: hypothetical protein M0R47_18990 [Methylobacter sp.]|uniref:hypothetical protein n=1 Tax=Methylobacter sp. TaxID=2051955 RepID=UPI0025D6606B|nr:hypothetical protein [Methylobacter sp.]MCK9622608.1 hypothetical protein [Methylobacter sp.]
MSHQPEALLYIDGKVEPAKLAALLGVNISLIYQEKQQGLFGEKEFIDMTYREAIQVYRNRLKKSVELKVAKEETERQIKLKKIEEDRIFKEKKAKNNMSGGLINLDGEDTMHPLMKKKMIQEIKLSRVKEVQSWMKVAEEKKQFLNAAELTNLLEPFMHVIKNVLISISTDYPQTQEKIDSCMNNLYGFGEKLLQQVNEDEAMFVEEMLDKDIDDEILELSFVPSEREEM